MKNYFILSLLLIASFANSQQKVIALYSAKVPGSENWNWQEESGEIFGNKAIYNVVAPTLTIYPAQAMVNTGTAVIIAPGGGFHFLSISSEGSEVAEWLSKKGITAFVLKYRLVHTTDPSKEFIAAASSGAKFDSIVHPVLSLAMNDGLAAVAYVRKNAATYGVSPDRIGFMGFSAGGGVTMSVAFNGTEESRPNFIAPIYAGTKAVDEGTMGGKLPVEKMPAFIVAASDDEFGLVPVSIDLYNKWVASKQSAELIVYQNGGHGFGMKKKGKLSDSWTDRFEEWMGENGWLWPENPTGMFKGVTYKMFKNYMASQEEQQRLDYANRKRYAADNAALALPKATEQRVVFMGNSITEAWKATDSSFFISHQYINRGISGQTTSQMLLRFREDVIDLKPKTVVILAGINDIAENTGPIALESIFGNIVSMTELARAASIKVVLSSVLPANTFTWRPNIQPAEKVVMLNSMIRAFAINNKIEYVDYYTPMVDDKKGLKAEFTNDGVHPTLAGYKVMEPLVEKGIADALKR